MKYIKRLAIDNLNFDFSSLKDLTIINLHFVFKNLSNEDLFKASDLIINQPNLQKENIINSFINQAAFASISLKHDSEILKMLINFCDQFKIDFIKLFNYLDYISSDSPRIIAIEDYLKRNPVYLFNYFVKIENPNLFSKDEIQEFEKIFVSHNIIANKYFNDILEDYLKIKNSINDNEIGDILEKDHPHIYNFFINDKNPDIRFIYNYINKRLPEKIEAKMFEKNDVETISYIDNYIKKRVLKFEASLMNRNNFNINITIKYFDKIIINYYLQELKDKTLENLKKELNTTLEDFMFYFAKHISNYIHAIKMFDRMIGIFVRPESENVDQNFTSEQNEKKHQFFINDQHLSFLVKEIKNDPKLFYQYCLISYHKPWREFENILFRRIDDVTDYSSYTIVIYLRDIVLPFYNKDVKAMLNDYKDFEQKILKNPTGNETNVIMSYMTTIRGRWPEGEAYLIEQNKKITDLSLENFLNKINSLKNYQMDNKT
jgi:hypothetical protein